MSVEIIGLPPNMCTIPVKAREFGEWSERALTYRAIIRERCERDSEARKTVIAAAARDPLYDFLVFGCIFEPRDRLNTDGTLRKSGWYPWVPYEFQGRLIRWIQETMAAAPGTPAARLGRGDGVLEKARGMAGSWTFCGYIANQWRYSDGFVAGVMSYKEDLVEKTNSTDSLFYKIEGFLGLDQRVPEFRLMSMGGKQLEIPVRPPSWMIPEGYEQRQHNQDLTLAHPTRTNVINGYSTGERTGVGGRASLMFLDEAAKFPAFMTVWQSMSAVTDHRFACSSADIRFGTGFRDLARVAEEASKSKESGPGFLRLRPDEHPERDEVWRDEIEARHTGLASAQEALAREYDLDYEASSGAYIYPGANHMTIKPIDFNPSNQRIDFCIDPGIANMCAFHLVSYDPGLHRYGLLASYANNGKPAEFYASLAMASPMTGDYDYTDDDERIMEWFERFGKHIRYWVGDPAGKQRGGGSATSFYDDFFRATDRLTDGNRRVMIWSSDKSQYKHLKPRIESLREMLKIMDINNAPDTLNTLKALNDHRYPEIPDDRSTTSTNAVPIRHGGHDRVTALEFYACHRKFGSTAAVLNEPVGPVRMMVRPSTPKSRHWDGRVPAEPVRMERRR